MCVNVLLLLNPVTLWHWISLVHGCLEHVLPNNVITHTHKHIPRLFSFFCGVMFSSILVWWDLSYSKIYFWVNMFLTCSQVNLTKRSALVYHGSLISLRLDGKIFWMNNLKSLFCQETSLPFDSQSPDAEHLEISLERDSRHQEVIQTCFSQSTAASHQLSIQAL